jgi:hypothetical protein
MSLGRGIAADNATMCLPCRFAPPAGPGKLTSDIRYPNALRLGEIPRDGPRGGFGECDLPLMRRALTPD